MVFLEANGLPVQLTMLSTDSNDIYNVLTMHSYHLEYSLGSLTNFFLLKSNQCGSMGAISCFDDELMESVSPIHMYSQKVIVCIFIISVLSI